MGEHFDLYFAGWYNDDMMQIIIDNDYNSNRIQDVLSACKESGIIPENSKLNQNPK